MNIITHLSTSSRRAHSRFLILLALTACIGPAASARLSGGYGNVDAADVLGTWAGSSICVGNRPACKNEEVVYRFLTVPGQAGLVTLLADKVIDGKRVPMYTLQFSYKEVDRSDV